MDVSSLKPVVVKPLDVKRFNALAGHSRSPAAAYVSEELAWYTNESETILGVILLDTVDNDYAAVALARDDGGRFRAFEVEASFESEVAATEWVMRVIRWHTAQNLTVYPQGDTSETLDLFTPVMPPDQLHPSFLHLVREPTLTPARMMIAEMMPHFHDVDGNFLQQFQSVGFDARVWELYVHAYLARGAALSGSYTRLARLHGQEIWQECCHRGCDRLQAPGKQAAILQAIRAVGRAARCYRGEQRGDGHQVWQFSLL